MNPLIGKLILTIEIASDRKAIRFLIPDEQPVIARADGDCCSETWIEHIEMPAGGLPAKVQYAEEVDLKIEPHYKESQYGEDGKLIDLENDDSGFYQYYGFRILTDKGEIFIEYRNRSNGYYGGSLEWEAESFDGGFFGQNISTEDWQPLKDIFND